MSLATMIIASGGVTLMILSALIGAAMDTSSKREAARRVAQERQKLHDERRGLAREWHRVTVERRRQADADSGRQPPRCGICGRPITSPR